MKKYRTLSSSTLSKLDNRKADGEDMRYLKQPRGPGTSWVFRFVAPAHLIGLPNPWDGKPIRGTIARGLKTRHLPTARKRRDQLLGDILRLQEALSDDAAFSLATAEEWREAVLSARETATSRANVGIELVLHGKLEEAEARGVPQVELERFSRFASGKGFPLSRAHEQYLHARRPGNPHGYSPLKLATTLNLATAVKHLRAFLRDDGETACLEDVTLSDTIKFRDEYLPGLKGHRSPDGLSAKTIAKNITLLRPIWVWAMETRRLGPDATNPWDFPEGLSRSGIKTERQRDPYAPEETAKLLKATSRGTRQGDVIRLAIATGCRVDELASLNVAQVKPDGTGFRVEDAKTKNGNRFIPVVGEARTLLQARLAAHGSTGRLFPEWPIRPATEKAAAVSQWFTRFRRDTLGEETDGRLTMHSTRHTWFTVALRAGLQERGVVPRASLLLLN
ncbi:site-specific recombinase XerD [Defluviimonas denitrificans]|jgi:integrase|uniref:Site-specific recombinase XerD n=1 Tax=Albidovulum denitrificans TaxID=404881 RepID=A0A2S8SAU9_9RHOB|nr:tyrosine-type recombinase/integrase [Defluviimonas denitrificans]PQV57838.1 site-specific recombinase XerD [Defluviimonas denitrificans]